MPADPTPGPRPLPPPLPDPAELALANVLSLALRGDGPDARYALEHTLASAKRKGTGRIDRIPRLGPPHAAGGVGQAVLGGGPGSR